MWTARFYRWFAILCFLPCAHCQMHVLAPEWLVTAFSDTGGAIVGSTATFGAPFFGEQVMGRLVYDDSPGHHCKADDYDIANSDKILRGASGGVPLALIVVVHRGSCSFTTKVRVAMQKGAHAVVIVDMEEPSANDAVHELDMDRVVVADDGTGVDVRIPSLLVSRETGTKLIEATRDAEVIVELTWGVPTSSIAAVDLWMSSASSLTGKFVHDFSSVRRLLNHHMHFQPHYYVFSVDKSQQDVGLLCLDDTGEFCAEDPDGTGPVTGAMVLQEDLRQLCLHDSSRGSVDEDGKPSINTEYWDYVERLMEACPIEGTPPHRFGDECSLSLMHSLDEGVQSCVQTTSVDKLQEQRANVAWSPTALQINGWRYTGIIDADLVTRAICTGFERPPAQCTKLISSPSPFQAPAGTRKSSQSLGNTTSGLPVVDAELASTLATALEKLLHDEALQDNFDDLRPRLSQVFTRGARPGVTPEMRAWSIAAASILIASACGGFAIGMCYHARVHSARLKELNPSLLQEEHAACGSHELTSNPVVSHMDHF